MSQKILYKVTAYHCPACGGSTSPDKRFCDYCGRELKDESYYSKSRPKIRLLAKCENGFVYFNDIIGIERREYKSYIDCTYLEDTRPRMIMGLSRGNTLDFTIPFTKRGNELGILVSKLGLTDIRFEAIIDKKGMAFETNGYFSSCFSEITEYAIAKQKIKVIADNSNSKYINEAIPQNVIDEMRCPNCGAPIKSRLCACEYCGGWNEIEW